jgi:hypothetical protein
MHRIRYPSDMLSDPSYGRRTIAVVLGMHRSGTSLCSNVLATLGIDMTKTPNPLPSNIKGHWERLDLLRLQESIYERFNRGYENPCHDLPFPPGWNREPSIQPTKEAISKLLREQIKEGVAFGFKDPRTGRLLTIWNEIFDGLGLVPKFIVCFRHPAQVARSLMVREGLDIDIGEYRWLVYMTDILSQLHDRQFCLVEYEGWFVDPLTNTKRIMELLGVENSLSPVEMRDHLNGVVDTALRHDSNAEVGQKCVLELYDVLRLSGENREAMRQALDISSSFLANRTVHMPIFHFLDRSLREQTQDTFEASREAVAPTT